MMKQELITKKELPEGWKLWELLKLSDVCISIDSGTWGNDPQEDNSFPILRSNNIQDSKIDFNDLAFRSVSKKNLINKTLEIGDIIVTKSSGSSHLIGKNAIFETGNKKTYLFANFLERLKPNKAIILPKFLYYYLNSPSGKDVIDKMHSTTSGLRNLNLNMYKEQILLVPPLPIQQKIVSKLDRQMAQIEMMKKEAAREIENTRELLDSYLKDFFQNKVDETWHTSKLGDVCIINPRKPELVYSDNQPTSFIPMESVDAEGGVVNNPKIQPFVKVKKGYTYFEENDVLFAKITPCMQNKKSAVAKDLINKFGFGTTEWHVFRCKENILPEWVFYFIRQQSFIEQAKSRFTGAVGQQRVPKDFIGNYEISYPDIEIQTLLISKLKNIITEQETIMKAMTNQLNAISQLPSSILNEVFGQYKIPEEA